MSQHPLQPNTMHAAENKKVIRLAQYCDGNSPKIVTMYFFQISTLDSLHPDSDRRNVPNSRPYNQIVCISQGSGHFRIDLEKYPIEDETIYTIPAGRVYQMLPAGCTSGWVLSFNLDFLCLAIEGPAQPLFKEIDTDLKVVHMYSLNREDRAVQNMLVEISREFKASLMLRLEILSGLFKVFLMCMKRQSTSVRREEAKYSRTRLFNSFYAKLDNQFRTMKQVADYANELFVSPNYLTDVVKKVSGHSASYHIQQRTVQEAKRLIMYDDASMKVVAYALGFEDLSHFSKYFKKAAGMNFSDFRKNTVNRLVN
jgi:AraC family transcriptional activator of pobA